MDFQYNETPQGIPKNQQNAYELYYYIIHNKIIKHIFPKYLHIIQNQINFMKNLKNKPKIITII